jgi:hypothetical protein
MLRLCHDVVLHVGSLSPYWRELFLRSTPLGQGVILDRQVSSLLQNVLFSIFRLKLGNRIQNSNCNKVKFSEHFFIIFLYVMYYASLFR